MDPELQSRAIVVDGKAESLIVYFRDNASIKRGLKFSMEHMGRVIVYVGADDFPVAIQFIDPLPQDAVECSIPTSVVDDAVSRKILYALSCKMIWDTVGSVWRPGSK